MSAIKMIAALALATAAATATSSAAFAQYYGYGPVYAPPPIVMPAMVPMPYGPPPVIMPAIAPMPYGLPAVPAPHYNSRGMGVDLTPIGPYAGAAVARGLGGMGVPAPIAGWAGNRVSANAESAGREYTPTDAGIKVTTGISMRDIRENGIAGGENSEVRKIGRMLGF